MGAPDVELPGDEESVRWMRRRHRCRPELRGRLLETDGFAGSGCVSGDGR